MRIARPDHPGEVKRALYERGVTAAYAGHLDDATEALPGTEEKLAILSARVARGLPLWHPRDRRTFDDTEASYE